MPELLWWSYLRHFPISQRLQCSWAPDVAIPGQVAALAGLQGSRPGPIEAMLLTLAILGDAASGPLPEWTGWGPGHSPTVLAALASLVGIVHLRARRRVVVASLVSDRPQGTCASPFLDDGSRDGERRRSVPTFRSDWRRSKDDEMMIPAASTPSSASPGRC